MKKYSIDISFILLSICFILSPYQKDFFIIFVCLCIHELGHIFFVKLFKLNIRKVKLYAFGFLMDVNEDNLSFTKEFFLYSGGILFNLISFFILPSDWNQYILIIIILNLMPIYPLDGCMVFKSILSYFLPYRITLYIASSISMIVLSVMTFVLFNHADYLLLVNIIYLWYIVIKEFKSIKFKYESFCLNRYLYPKKYGDRKVKFRHNNDMYIFKFHVIFSIIGNKRVGEYELLKLKYEKI